MNTCNARRRAKNKSQLHCFTRSYFSRPPRENTARKLERMTREEKERERCKGGTQISLITGLLLVGSSLPRLRNPSLPLKNPPQCLRGFAASAHRSPSLPQPGACRTPRTHFRYDGCPFPNAGTPRTRTRATRNARTARAQGSVGPTEFNIIDELRRKMQPALHYVLHYPRFLFLQVSFVISSSKLLGSIFFFRPSFLRLRYSFPVPYISALFIPTCPAYR